jgi:hypothetical protein
VKSLIVSLAAALLFTSGTANAVSTDSMPGGQQEVAGSLDQNAYGDRYDRYDDRYDRRDDRRWRNGRHRGEWQGRRHHRVRYVLRCHREWRHHHRIRVCHRIRIRW